MQNIGLQFLQDPFKQYSLIKQSIKMYIYIYLNYRAELSTFEHNTRIIRKEKSMWDINLWKFLEANF